MTKTEQHLARLMPWPIYGGILSFVWAAIGWDWRGLAVGVACWVVAGAFIMWAISEWSVRGKTPEPTLSRDERAVLSFLSMNEDSSSRKVGAEMYGQIERGASTYILIGLETDGLVSKRLERSHPMNSQFVYRITNKGRQVLQQEEEKY